jgi:hypothetical protein
VGKGDSPSLPNTPAYQQDTDYRNMLKTMSGLGNNLTNMDFSSNPMMADTVSMFNPELSNKFATTLQNSLQPSFDRSNQDLTNTLANTGGLGASTASDALSQNYRQFMNTIGTQTGQFDVTNATNALQNRVNLFNTGVGLDNSVAGYGATNENNLNNFNLQNYSNQVAQQMYQDQNKQGGWAGALKGGLGGAVTGLMAGGPNGAVAGAIAGGASGYFSPQGGAGGSNQLLNMGGASAGLLGMKNMLQPTTPSTTGRFTDSGADTTLTANPNDEQNLNLFRQIQGSGGVLK